MSYQSRYGMANNHYQMNASLLTDGYKLDHRRQYPKGTEYGYANWHPHSHAIINNAVVATNRELARREAVAVYADLVTSFNLN